MKRHIRDIFSDIALFFIRPIVVFVMSREITVKHEGEVLKKDKDPFIMISNHFNTWDAFVIAKNIKRNIRYVVTEIAFLDFSKKVLMRHFARAIKKRVGKPDMPAMKRVYKSLKQGYVVGIFPEGDNTFYGETLDIYQSTGKLLKRTKVDVYLVKQFGGYVSQPRWADYFSKKGQQHTKTSLLFKKEELEKLSIEEINKEVEKAIYLNDYEWQREKMFDFDRKNRAEGIERLVYVCSNCNGILTVSGKGHDMVCSECGTIGTINKYEFIEGNKFDNLVDYNHFQYGHIEEVVKSEFAFHITLNTVDTKKLKNKKIGKYHLHYKDKQLYLHNKTDELTLDMTKIRFPVCTMRHSFSFDYEDITYNFTDIKHQFALYEMCRYINGSYKE